jgi:hypothetical protein
MGEMIHEKLWSRKPEGKKPCGGTRRRFEGNIRMVREIGWRLWTGFIWLRIGTSGGLL